MNIVYIDETWIDTSYTAKYCWQSKDERGALLPISWGRLIVVHGGGCTGFVPGALLVWKATSSTGDYHNEMNGQNFQKCVCEKLLENNSVKSVIVMDNASYHSCKSEKCPNSSACKADIQAWLTKHNIPFDKKLLRPELFALAKVNKPEPQYIIDDIAKEKGHIILRLPPYHPDLNPIELVWAQLKKIVSSRNFTNKLNDVLEMTKAAFIEISVQNWENYCKHVINVEEEYTRKDIVIDQEMDNFVIELADDTCSSNSDDQDNDD